jgi:hypothetical protein
MATAIEAEKIAALNYFRGIDHNKIFENAEFETVCAFEKGKDEIRIILQNTLIGSDNEEELVFVKLVGSNGAGLPIEAMKSGYPINQEDLEIQKVTYVRSQVTITVSSIKIGRFKLSKGNVIELV